MVRVQAAAQTRERMQRLRQGRERARAALRIGGRARNPYAIAMPAGEPVPAALLPDYRAHAAPLVARLELLAAQPLARLE